MSTEFEAICLLLLAMLVGSLQQQPCPTNNCICTGTRIVCNAQFLTEFPEFPDDIEQAATVLELGSNMITSIQSTDLEGFVSLQTLDLSFNSIRSIEPGSFSSNTQLSSLVLSQNNLSAIPDNLFENVTRLSHLDLSGNSIGSLTQHTFNGIQSSVSRINLADNLIRNLLESTFITLEQLSELSLSGNPIHCDCQLRWFPRFRLSNGNLSSNLGQCITPTHIQGMPLQTINEEHLMCDCNPPCANGDCNMTVGVCECMDGYVGPTCDTACPAGSFGPDCSQTCSCVPEHESSPCDHINGSCYCQPGYTGEFCEEECTDGFYGQDCVDVCSCVNGDCHFITGLCNCSAGYVGSSCSMACPPLRYGHGCSQICPCRTGGCDHVTGDCICPEGYLGQNCGHNCTGAPNCSDIGREECSEQTPQQMCGTCLPGHVGVAGNGNTECTLCSGAPNCSSLQRQPCSTVPDTCGPCHLRHITETPGSEGHNNVPCFDPCIDGEMNYNETGVDCGGPLCPPCFANQTCSDESDCGIGSICLGYHVHSSGLIYPFNEEIINTCRPSHEPGNEILNRFKNAFRGNENPLSYLDPITFTKSDLEAGVEQELRTQFNIIGNMEVTIYELEQEVGNPLYQTGVLLEDDDSFEIMKVDIQNGRLSATVLFNYEGKKVLYNF